MENIYLITGNNNKARETSQILGFDIEVKTLDIEEIQSVSSREVASQKAKNAYEKLKSPVLVEDVGFYVDAWDGYPGALIKWVEEYQGVERLSKYVLEEETHTAIAETTLCYYDGENLKSFTAALSGKVVEPVGENGFGFDKIFLPEGELMTMGQMSEEKKNSMSMRAEAYQKLKDYLKKFEEE